MNTTVLGEESAGFGFHPSVPNQYETNIYGSWDKDPVAISDNVSGWIEARGRTAGKSSTETLAVKKAARSLLADNAKRGTSPIAFTQELRELMTGCGIEP